MEVLVAGVSEVEVLLEEVDAGPKLVAPEPGVVEAAERSLREVAFGEGLSDHLSCQFAFLDAGLDAEARVGNLTGGAGAHEEDALVGRRFDKIRHGNHAEALAHESPRDAAHVEPAAHVVSQIPLGRVGHRKIGIGLRQHHDADSRRGIPGNVHPEVGVGLGGKRQVPDDLGLRLNSLKLVDEALPGVA